MTSRHSARPAARHGGTHRRNHALRIVWVADLEGPPLRIPRCRIRPISDAELFARWDAPPNAVVLGAGVFRRHAPEQLIRALFQVRQRTVLCTDSCDAAAIHLMTLAGFVHAVPRCDLEECLQTRLALFDRAQIDPGGWLGASPAPDSPEGLAIAALDNLPCLRVGSWAKTIGMTTRQLRLYTMHRFRAQPSLVLRRYVRAQVEALRARGLPLDSIAPVLGYADGSSLCRAVHSLEVRSEPTGEQTVHGDVANSHRRHAK